MIVIIIMTLSILIIVVIIIIWPGRSPQGPRSFGKQTLHNKQINNQTTKQPTTNYACTSLSLSIYLSIYLSISLYIYIYIYVHTISAARAPQVVLRKGLEGSEGVAAPILARTSAPPHRNGKKQFLRNAASAKNGKTEAGNIQ